MLAGCYLLPANAIPHLALFNSLNWLESSHWDGRLAIVVAGDIAVCNSYFLLIRQIG